jgi:hypothetical protein
MYNYRTRGQLFISNDHKVFCVYIRVKVDVKYVPVRKTLRYRDLWVNGCIDSRFLHLGTIGGEWSASRPCRFTPQKEPSLPIVKKVGWALEPV